MELRQLRHFLAVAETLHFGRAAERLGMTQPPLSQSILALERELGASLFARNRRSVALTDFGRQWMDHVRPAVAAVDALPEVAHRLRSGTTGKLTLSFVSTADYNLLPQIVKRYAAAFPDVEISLVEATSDVQIDGLVAGRFDAGIVIAGRSERPIPLSYRPLLREPLLAALPEEWIEERRVRLTKGALAGSEWMDRPLIIFPERVAPHFHRLVTDHYGSKGRPLPVVQEAIQMQTIVSLVSAGIGMALVPASIRHLARTGVRYLPLADGPPQLETGLAWKSDHLSATVRNLLAIATGESTASGGDARRRG